MNTALAFITASIAVIVALITWSQWQTSRNQLKLALFEKRYEVYERITGFMADALIAGRIDQGRDIEFLRETKRAKFLFEGDDRVTGLISKIYKKALDLHAYQAQEKSLSGEELRANLEKQKEIKDWYQKALSNMESCFEPYLTMVV